MLTILVGSHSHVSGTLCKYGINRGVFACLQAVVIQLLSSLAASAEYHSAELLASAIE